MRIWLSPLLVLLLVPGYAGLEPLHRLGTDARMTATPVDIYPGDPARRRVGALTYLGGVRLRGDDPEFGGFSAMRVRGEDFLLLGDRGSFVRFAMGRDWRVRDVRFGNLPVGPGTGWLQEDRDSESLAADPQGRLWVGFENANAIWRYAPGFARAEAHAAPPVMANWPDNRGAEAMARLRDGRFVVISEGKSADRGKGRVGVVFSGDPTLAPRRGFRFVFVPPRGYQPDECVELPDGRLLVMVRRFALPFHFKVKLVVVDRGAIRPGAVVRGREIADFSSPVLEDNYEALAVTREGRDTILWIASDDNQSALQQSLLLKFRLDG